MCTVTNLKRLIEENTWPILFIVIQHLVYAKILIFCTVSHVKNNMKYLKEFVNFPPNI